VTLSANDPTIGKDDVLQTLQSIYESVCKESLSDKHGGLVLSALLSYRYILPVITEYPARVFRRLFLSQTSDKVVYPCDVIDLRRILSENKIYHNNVAAGLFPYRFAEKYLHQYPVFVVVDTKQLEKVWRFGPFAVHASPVMIGSALREIIVNQPTTDPAVETVRGIIHDTEARCDFIVSTPVPGVSSSHLRQSSSFNLKKEAALQEIQLDQQEARIFDLLKAVKAGMGLATEFRVAGGWVRDKMLGLESDDIDIAVSNMTGADIVRAIKEYGQSHPEVKNAIGGTYIVDQNIEKSKHLETAGIDLFGQKIEFVNLRSESYADSRVPEMEMGTPETDAARRDLTINSMFYNVETGEVEDYVGGKNDLQNNILRTPMDPVQTFIDDPLRMLRALRFHSRYDGSQIDPAIIEAMRMPEVQDAYRNKVSPERAGPELMKMMAGANPASAVEMLLDTDLYMSVFNIPEVQGLRGVKMDQHSKYHEYNIMNHTVEVVRNLNRMMVENDEDSSTRALMNLAGLFHDFGKLHPEIQKPHKDHPDRMQYIGHEDVSADIAEKVLKSIGVPGDDREFVKLITQMHMRPHLGDWTPRAMGRFLRKSIIPGQESRTDTWKYIFYHAMADAEARGEADYSEDINGKRQRMSDIEQFIASRPQQPAINSMLKPLLNGGEIMALVPELEPKTGFIRRLNEMLLEAQDTGDVGTPEDARQFVLNVKPQLLQEFGQGAQAMNWYGEIKTADASTGVPTGDVEDFHPYEGTPWADADDEITYMQREKIKRPKKAKPGKAFEKDPEKDETRLNQLVGLPLKPGDGVRRRSKGVAQKQIYGRVISITDNKVKIKWDGKDKEEEIPLNETIFLAHEIEKV
jgi:tRNA nucleotidyltransferase/poly(A) polymerase